MKQLILTLTVLLCMGVAQAQDNAAQNDMMRAGGKIYVVMAVSVTILVGLFIYVIRLDRKISRLEKHTK